MANKDEIRNIIELFIAWNGETEPIDVANIDSAVEFIGSSLQAELVSEDLEEVAKKYGTKKHPMTTIGANESAYDFKAGANWQKENLDVKRVDLQKKLYGIKRACGIFKENDIGEISGNCLNWIAKYFFELGIKHRK